MQVCTRLTCGFASDETAANTQKLTLMLSMAACAKLDTSVCKSLQAVKTDESEGNVLLLNAFVANVSLNRFSFDKTFGHNCHFLHLNRT